MKVALLNLGCPKNQKDGEVALASFLQHGFKYTSQLEQADAIIINTCGFIDEAKEESISTAISSAKYKKSGKCKALIMTGCLSQRYSGELKKEMPEVDIFLGVSTYPRAYEMFHKFISGKKSISFVDQPGFIYSDCDYIHDIQKSGYMPETFTYSAYVKIAEGCKSKCTYCSIPSIRGNLATRSHESIISEIKFLVGSGVKEIVLIAQDLTANETELKKLLRKIGKLPKKERPDWARLMYCNPWGVDDELISIIKNEEWITKYIDMPIQHISDRVLKRMGRKGDAALIMDLVSKMRASQIVLRSTVLVGFPGETAKDFERLRALVSDGWFHWLGIFVFSPQEGTSALAMADRVPDDVAIDRRNELDRTQFEVTTALNEGYVDSTLPVLVNNEVDGVTEGRIFAQAPVIDGVVRFEGKVKGPFVDVRIEQVNGFDLIGKIL